MKCYVSRTALRSVMTTTVFVLSAKSPDLPLDSTASSNLNRITDCTIRGILSCSCICCVSSRSVLWKLLQPLLLTFVPQLHDYFTLPV
jgi:hypothetical protein